MAGKKIGRGRLGCDRSGSCHEAFLQVVRKALKRAELRLMGQTKFQIRFLVMHVGGWLQPIPMRPWEQGTNVCITGDALWPKRRRSTNGCLEIWCKTLLHKTLRPCGSRGQVLAPVHSSQSVGRTRGQLRWRSPLNTLLAQPTGVHGSPSKAELTSSGGAPSPPTHDGRGDVGAATS